MGIPRIVGISGKIASGKTTYCNLLLNKFNEYCRLSYGDILKEETSDLFNYPLEWAYDQILKYNVVNPEICSFNKLVFKRFLYFIGLYKPNMPFLPYGNMTVRSVLQWYGTNYIRKNNPDYWVDLMNKKLISHPWAIIEDVRFKNEANQIKKLGGLLIRIEPHDKWDPGIYWNHPSETDLDEYADFDLIIHPKFGEIEKNLKIIKQFIEK